MIKQVEIWRFEHSERMQIMALFGAPSWMRSGLLFRIALADSVVASALIGGALYYLTRHPFVDATFSEFGLGNMIVSGDDLMILFGASLLISILSVAVVIIREKE